MLQSNIDVGHANHERDRLIIDLRNQGHARIDDQAHFLRHMLCLRASKRHKAPVVFPGFVENGSETGTLPGKIAKIKISNSDRSPAHTRFDQPSQPGKGRLFRIKPPTVPIELLAETIAVY